MRQLTSIATDEHIEAAGLRFPARYWHLALKVAARQLGAQLLLQMSLAYRNSLPAQLLEAGCDGGSARPTTSSVAISMGFAAAAITASRNGNPRSRNSASVQLRCRSSARTAR